MSYLWYWPKGGWDFERWRDAQTWRSAPDDNCPLPLRGDGADRLTWERERGRLQRRLGDLLGSITDEPPGDGPRWEFLGAELIRRDTPGYSLCRLRYALTNEEWGYAWLLVPEGERRPRPAVIVLHQTVAQGKAEVVGLDGGPGEGRDYGRELVEEGFVVLAPDAIGFGERMAEHANAFYRSGDQFFAAHPQGSVMGKMAYDTSRAVDLVQSMPGVVDPDRIGCIGHSHGGYGTLFAMLADERIKAGVISCGLSRFRTDPGVERWWRRTALIPRLGFYEGRIDRVPLDVEHLLALVAPRPLLVAAAREDDCFPRLESLPVALDEARRVYDLYGAGDNLRGLFFDGGHRFSLEARRAGYALLREALMPEGVPA
jgi:dienelactone hydrolase